MKPGSRVGKCAGHVIGRLRVRVRAGAAGEFSSPELTFCADSYSVFVPPPVLPQTWHVKDPGLSAKSAGGRLHLNSYTLDPTKSEWAHMLSRRSVGTYQGNELSPTLQGTLGYGGLSSLSHVDLSWPKKKNTMELVCAS